ncbi:uncharacterized protein ColSpa_01798 [Colletotrichum spaethianum]|uniref:Uncharacterized protein n=1 Tax=Colletotrichum spaethianum TaxID=700344 RepID=A0AA37NU37_9PEZI|nr:uncharacterized protein ColSpa_01798 [Colletotrichum spaethianum]GKT41617.1 hypothetical protein ColSpa_01798 [Colletotrichum spaethianum]
MDHDQLRSLSSETAGCVHVDNGFTRHSSTAFDSYHAPLDMYSDQLHFIMGPYAYDLPVPNIQEQDPEQAWKQVSTNLPVRISSPWDPVAPNADFLAPKPEHDNYGSTATLSHPTYSQTDTSYLGHRRIAPSTGDERSIISEYTNNSNRSTKCSDCGALVNSRLMQRHRQDRHRQDDDLQYTCKCTYKAPPARKWNYLRHIDKCKVKDDSQRAFTCICQKTSNDLQPHLDHIKDCGKKRVGRPPNSARTIS